MEAENGQRMNLCLKCRRRLRTCVCSHLLPFSTESRFIILMHPMEYKKEKVGTGRFTHLILKNSEIIVDIGFDENKRFQEVLQAPEYETFVLYPGDKAIDISSDNGYQVLGSKKKQFIVIDGTWPCAKKMMKLTNSLHQLPRISFSAKRLSEFHVKHQPLPGCLSTVESIHQVLIELNRLQVEKTGGAEENLMSVFRHTVNEQIKIAQNPGEQGYRRRAYSAGDERKISKKWNERLIFFKDE